MFKSYFVIFYLCTSKHVIPTKNSAEEVCTLKDSFQQYELLKFWSR